MESLATSARIFCSSSSAPLSIFSPRKPSLFLRFPSLQISAKNGDGHDFQPDTDETALVPLPKSHSSFCHLPKDEAMGLVLSAAVGRGWTTGSGMEGPPAPESNFGDRTVSTFPWSLFTKSPRRRMRVAFTCNVCGQRTTRAINPHAYTDGTVFVQVSHRMDICLILIFDRFLFKLFLSNFLVA